MAWRFKASKYKNAAPIVPKFEQHIRDLVSTIAINIVQREFTFDGS